MKGSLVFIIEEENRIKSEIGDIRKQLISLEAEEAAIKAVATGNEQKVSDELTAMRQELAKWSEIEALSSTETSLKNVRGEIKKRQDKILSLENQSKSFERLTAIKKERGEIVIKYHSLAKSFTDACFAAKEAYELNLKENEKLARVVESELKKMQTFTETTTDMRKKTPMCAAVEETIQEETMVAKEDKNTLLPPSSVDQVNESDNDAGGSEILNASDSAFRTPLDVIYDYMAEFDRRYKEAIGTSDNVEEYEAGYQFLFERVSVNRDDAYMFKAAVMSEEPFMGLDPKEKKTLLWALPKAFLKRVGLCEIIEARASGNKDYGKDALNKLRPKFTFSFVVDLMTVVNTGIEEDILSFFYENTDSYEKTKKFGFPKPIEKALPKVS